MRYIKTKIFMFAVAAMFIMFFSNDFGLIDIEKNAIITAVAIDKSIENEYEVSAQIAVPEASNKNPENKKALITGKGSTVGAAIKNVGSISGWFPKLTFCNLIVIGQSVADENIINVLDYFSKTLRIQNSALVLLAEDSGKDLLTCTSPLDNISSFALQKILFKNPGFDVDVSPTDIKTFCTDYYSSAKSSFMPLVKTVKQDPSGQKSGGLGGSSNSSSADPGQQNSSSSSPSPGSSSGNTLFDATATALFYKGMKVGQLDTDATLIFNLLTRNACLTTYQLDNVYENNTADNYLLTILRNYSRMDLDVTDSNFKVTFVLDIYCKIRDQNFPDPDLVYSDNSVLPFAVKEKMEQDLTEGINRLIATVKQTGCDILKIKESLFRHHYSQYARYKDNYLDVMETVVRVNVTGQK